MQVSGVHRELFVDKSIKLIERMDAMSRGYNKKWRRRLLHPFEEMPTQFASRLFRGPIERKLCPATQGTIEFVGHEKVKFLLPALVLCQPALRRNEPHSFSRSCRHSCELNRVTLFRGVSSTAGGSIIGLNDARHPTHGLLRNIAFLVMLSRCYFTRVRRRWIRITSTSTKRTPATTLIIVELSITAPLSANVETIDERTHVLSCSLAGVKSSPLLHTRAAALDENHQHDDKQYAGCDTNNRRAIHPDLPSLFAEHRFERLGH